MDINSKYVKNVQERSKIHFYVGILTRLKNYLKNKYAVSIARSKGAMIGKSVSIPLALAKRANANLIVGNNTSIQSSKLDLRALVRIGNNVIIGSNVEIITCSHEVDSPDWEFKPYGITIEDFVWVATNALVLPSCTKIEYGAVVGAGSVVAKNVGNMDIVSGNTTVFIRKRKEVHFDLCVEGLLGNDLITYLKVRDNKI